MTVAELCSELQAWAHEGHAQDIALVELENGTVLHDVVNITTRDGRFPRVIIHVGTVGGWL